MQINFNVPFLDLDGNPALGDRSTTQGRVLSQVLASQPRGDAIKLMEWAMSCHQGKSLTLDIADFDTLREIVINTEMLPALSKGQILLTLKAAEACK